MLDDVESCMAEAALVIARICRMRFGLTGSTYLLLMLLLLLLLLLRMDAAAPSWIRHGQLLTADCPQVEPRVSSDEIFSLLTRLGWGRDKRRRCRLRLH